MLRSNAIRFSGCLAVRGRGGGTLPNRLITGTCRGRVPKTYFSRAACHLRADTRKSNGHPDSPLPGVVYRCPDSSFRPLRTWSRRSNRLVGIARADSCSPSSSLRRVLAYLSFSHAPLLHSSSLVPPCTRPGRLQRSAACSVANSCEFGLIGPSRLSGENA